MLGLQQEHSFSVYQSNERYISTRTSFSFWDEGKAKDYEKVDNVGEGELEFQTRTWIEDDHIILSPRLWESVSKEGRYEDSPLLPNNHHYSHLIANGRKELMEMIQNMPESSFELSLKDYVNNQQDVRADEQVKRIKEKNPKVRKELKINQKKKLVRKPPIPRSESMDSGVFLLKIFLPCSLGLKKKPKSANHRTIAPTLSFPESEKPTERQRWNIMSLITGENKHSSRIRKSNSSTRSSSSRHADSDLLPSCWSFSSKKRKSRISKCSLFPWKHQ